MSVVTYIDHVYGSLKWPCLWFLIVTMSVVPNSNNMFAASRLSHPVVAAAFQQFLRHTTSLELSYSLLFFSDSEKYGAVTVGAATNSN